MVLGEGEEVMGEIVDCYESWQNKGASRDNLLRSLAEIPGVYVPSLYKVSYNTDGTIRQSNLKKECQGLSPKARGFGRSPPSRKLACPLHRNRPRQGNAGDHAGLHPGLQVLPGRDNLQTSAGEIPEGKSWPWLINSSKTPAMMS